MRAQQTPAQTLGPFFHQGLARTRQTFQLPWLCQDPLDVIGNVLVNERTEGQRIRVEGVVYDGLGQPMVDALVEVWQANTHGRYNSPLDTSERALDPEFMGFGRSPTNEKGGFSFISIKPGHVPWLGGLEQAAHLNLILGARGMARHAFTRIYFEADAGLTTDPVLARVPAARRHTLIARAGAEHNGTLTYRFDLHLQGENETVFFEL
jgi:protocatechuate 3,4-dioxygenase alpha subunit